MSASAMPAAPTLHEAAAVQYALDRDGRGGLRRKRRHRDTAIPGGVSWRARGGGERRCRRALLLVEPRPLGEPDGAGLPDGRGRGDAAGTICGTSFTPAVVAAVAGLLLSRNPSLTGSQIVAALRVTARPVVGVANGRATPWPRSAGWGFSPSRRPGRARRGGRCRRGCRRRTRPALHEADALRDGHVQARVPLDVPSRPWAIEMQLLTPLASTCSLSSTRRATDGRRAGRQESDQLSVRVTAGRYTAEVQCRGARTRRYSLGVMRCFLESPLSFPSIAGCEAGGAPA